MNPFGAAILLAFLALLTTNIWAEPTEEEMRQLGQKASLGDQSAIDQLDFIQQELYQGMTILSAQQARECMPNEEKLTLPNERTGCPRSVKKFTWRVNRFNCSM